MIPFNSLHSRGQSLTTKNYPAKVSLVHSSGLSSCAYTQGSLRNCIIWGDRMELRAKRQWSALKCKVQFSHSVRLFITPWTSARQASLAITNSRSLSKLMSFELAMPSNHLVLCHGILLLPSIFPNIRLFSNESALHIRWPKYWSFSFNISPSSEHPGLIYFMMGWLDLLAIQGTLKSLQHHRSEASILRRSAFFIV